MRRTFKIMLIAGVIAAIGGVIYMAGEALWDKDNAVGPPASAPPPPSVPVAKALSRTLAPTAEFTGFLAAPETVELRSRVGGTLDAISVPEGRLVSRGQLLFQIDPRPFEVALDTAVAQLRQAEVLARQAQADFDRIQRLVASGAVSRKNADDVTATRNARQAQMQSAKAADLRNVNFSRIAFLATLIGPLAGTQLTFDIHLRTFTQIFAGHFRQFAEHHHPVPFSLLFHFAGLLIAPGFRSSQR